MKRIIWPTIFVICLTVVVAIVVALKFGERSPIIAAGQIIVTSDFMPSRQGEFTVFVIVYDEHSNRPMPYGAARYKINLEAGKPASFDFILTKETLQIMNPEQPLPQKLRIKARLDQDGLAGPDQMNDLVGEVRHIPLGQKNVKILINHRDS